MIDDQQEKLMASMVSVLKYLKDIVELHMCVRCVARTGSLKGPAFGRCPETVAAENLIKAYESRNISSD